MSIYIQIQFDVMTINQHPNADLLTEFIVERKGIWKYINWNSINIMNINEDQNAHLLIELIREGKQDIWNCDINYKNKIPNIVSRG
jgi:hypothetical protein